MRVLITKNKTYRHFNCACGRRISFVYNANTGPVAYPCQQCGAVWQISENYAQKLLKSEDEKWQKNS